MAKKAKGFVVPKVEQARGALEAGSSLPEVKAEDEPPIRFTAAQDFYSEETRSHYLKGYSYTARAGDHVLRGLIPRWISESKIVEGGPQATMTGQGQVQ